MSAGRRQSLDSKRSLFSEDVVARKDSYTKKIADEICRRIAGGEPLRQICRDRHMPSWQTVYQWMVRHEEFGERIARARQLGFDAIAEEALEIANTPMMGVETEKEGEKVKTRRADMLGHRKLQVWTRLQLLAKWCPQKYGDKREVSMTINESLAERLSRAKARLADKNK